MALTIIYGEAGTGKSEYCISAMLPLHKKGILSLLLVPEQFAHSAEARLIEKNGFMSDEIQATSFKRLAQRCLRQTGQPKDSISPIGKSMLLSRAILKTDNLSLYKRAASKPGFIDTMLTFIAECKRSEITPEQLTAASVRCEDTYFALKLSELAAIYHSYQELLKVDFTDSEDYLSLLAAYVQKSRLFSGCCIFIDEFFRFTPAELDCIRAILLSGAEVTVTLGASGAEAAGLFEPVAATARTLLYMAKEAGIPVNPPLYLKEKYRFADSPELAHFEREYHRYPPAVFAEPTKNLSLYISPDPYTETQALAAAICRTVQDNGLHYRDIAVIAGDTEIYSDLIKTVFPIYRIPVFIDRKRSLLSHPIIIMLSSLLELMTNGLETATLLAYCKTGYSGLSREETDRLENIALAGRLKRQDWLDDTRFLQRADSVFYRTESFEETNAEDAQALLALRDRLLTPLLTLRSALSQSRLVRDRAAAIFAFFEEISLYNKVEAEIETFKARNEQQQAQEHSEIYNLMITLLDELVLCLGEEKIGMRRLSSILTAGLSQCEISTIPPGNDEVFFGDVSRSLVKNVKALFVIGANDTAFPPAVPQEGLLKDEEKQLLARQGIELGPDGKKIVFHNQYLVYSALCISRGSLYISYPTADTEGKGLRPSSLIRRLYKLFPQLSVSNSLTGSPEAERIIAGKASAWQYMLEHFDEPDPIVRQLLALFGRDPDYTARLAAIDRSRRYTNQVEALRPETAHALYGTELRGSVTQLEKYVSCPFSYFLHYGLQAKERKILKIDAPDIGTLLHKLIELASRRLLREHKTFRELNPEMIEQLAEETVTDLLGSLFIAKLYGESRLAALIRRLKGLVAKMLQIISTHVARGMFEPCAFEVAFSETGELPPVKIPLPTGETITLTGRIDRIDVLRQNATVYIKIIDYKTGSKSFRLSDIYNSLSLQLAVYITAVTEGGSTLLGSNLRPAGMFYFRLADKTVDSVGLKAEDALLKQFKMSGLLLKDAEIVRAMDQGIQGISSIIPARIKQDGSLSDSGGSYATLEQFQKLSAHVKKTAGAIGREILQGKTAISPCKNGQTLPCQYCSFHAVCAFDAEKDAYRIAHPLKDEAVWALLDETEK